MVGFKEMNLIEPLVEELGLNSPQAGTMVAWMMDLYEQGLVTKEQLGGIDLKWGDTSGICELLKKIAYKEDIGKTLAEGFKSAIPAIGEKSRYYAWQNHWQGDARRDPRRYHRVYTVSAPELTDTATICIFSAFSVWSVFGSMEECIRQYLNAACGWDLNLNQLKEIESRNRLLGRCFSLREGYLPWRDDVLPDRCFEETLTDKYGNKLVLDRTWYANELKSFYTANGLSERGLPKRDNLKRLGLDYVIPELEPTGLIE
jgi:aldehyde:ferredoxin oxidoreductase